MNIFFITNYSKKYGGGHFNRCNKLAKKLGKKNNFFFLVDKKDDNLSKLVIKNSTLLLKKNIFNSPDEIIKILKSIKNPIVIIDSYLSNINFEKKIFLYCKKLIVIDDLKKNHFCNIYINPNFINFNFTSKIKANIKLLGPKYAFVDIRRKKKIIKKSKVNTIKNVLVFMGATDSRDLSIKIYNAIKEKNITHLKFKFIKGYNNVNLENIKKKNKMKNIKFLNFSNRFLDYLDKTDMFISSGGSSVWDSVFLQKKTLIFNHSSKQIENSYNLEKKGLIKVFKKSLTSKNISNFLMLESQSNNRNNFKFKNFFNAKGISGVVKKILNSK